MTMQTSEPVGDIDEALFERQIREIVHSGHVSTVREPTEAVESEVNNARTLVDRVAGASLRELDNMIVELQKLRVSLVSEGERLQRELADYGKLTRMTLRSSRIINETLPSCK